jgi:hypothetical protein
VYHRNRNEALGLILCAACSHPQAAGVPAANLDWTPFYWVRASTDAATFQHASILYRTAIGGRQPSLVQLDLASSGQLTSGLPEPAGTVHQARPVGQLYGLLGEKGRLEIRGSERDSALRTWRSQEIGTVGAPYFLRRVLVLDFVHERLAVVQDKAVTQSLAGAAFSVIPLPKGEFGRIELPLTTPAGHSSRMLLDTGLIPFPIWTTRSLWQELTGLTGPGPHTRSYRIPNPRGELVFVAAPIRRGALLGSWQLPSVEAVYLEQGPRDAALELWQPAIDGGLGPSLFAGRLMLLIDILGGRVGLLRP